MPDEPVATPVEPTEPSPPTEPVEPTSPAEPGEPTEPTEPQTDLEKMEQRIYSRMGRIVASQIEEKVLPHLQTPQPVQAPVGQDADALTKFNEQVQQKIFEGNPLEAFQMMQNVQTQANANILQQNKIATDTAITKFSDEPYYKDIHGDMTKLAHELVGQGIPPEHAATHAFQTMKANHLQKLVGGGEAGTGDLEMAGGGKRTTRSKKPSLNKMPPEFREAYEEAVDKNIFTNDAQGEADYIAHLSPQVRADYGV